MGSEIKEPHEFRKPEDAEAEKIRVIDNKKAKTDLVFIAGKFKFFVLLSF